MESQYKIQSVDFVTSVFEKSKLIISDLPEVAFVGRSNVGKSSLINALLQKKSLAKTSKTPGRTQSLNFFKVKYSNPEGLSQEAHVVDLPGYGYAKVAINQKKKWMDLLQSYLFEREQLVCIFLLLDSRRELGDEELWFFENFADEIIPILTKVDKLSKNELSKKISSLSKQVGISKDSIFSTSVLSSSKTGIEGLRDYLFKLF